MAELKRRSVPVAELAEEAKEAIEEPLKWDHIDESILVNTGSTMLNLACSGFSPYGGFCLGSIAHLIGDSNTGKSLLALSLMAEAARDARLKDYHLVYEEPEASMFFPLDKMFGSEISRINFIPKDADRTNPRTVQDWHNYLVGAEHPFIHVTDSFDALTSADAMRVKKDADGKKKEEGKGGYDTEKAIVASRTYPKIIGPMKANNSFMLLINQTRDDIGNQFGSGKGFGGGNAIKFYRTHEIWLAKFSPITKEVRGKKREIGQNVGVQIKKNKLTGKVRMIKFPVLYDYGVDDIGSIIDWLVEEGFWVLPKGKQIIEAEDPFPDATRPKLISYVEENGLENELKRIAKECWMELEKEIEIRRKPRY